jgi:hypothetical protein
MSESVDDAIEPTERAFADRAIRRKRLFLVLSKVSIAVAAGYLVMCVYRRFTVPGFEVGPRAVIVLLILLNARQNLRQHKYAAILEKLIR